MSWKNLKTFLIILFLCLNIYLLAITYRTNHSKELTDENIYNTWTILGNNNIAIDTNIIPRQAIEYETVELTAVSSENGTISITESTTINENSADSDIKNILKKSGIDTKNLLIITEDNTYYITQTYKGMRLFNNKLTVKNENGVVSVNGTWYNYKVTDNYKENEQNRVYATSALIAFISEFDGRETEITDITYGYYALTDHQTSNAKSISAAPCYRLTDDRDRIYYYNIPDNSFTE